MEQARAGPATAPTPAKLKALLVIATAVRDSERAVTAQPWRSPKPSRP